MTSWPTDHPLDDTVEVSIFGPGKGESCVVHLGSRKWIVVDSCIETRGGGVPALDYLRGLQVDVAKDVTHVVGTHPHDDHIAGLSQVFEAAESAYFVTPAAFTTKEFSTLLAADAAAATSAHGRVYSEYFRIAQMVADRDKQHQHSRLFLAGHNGVLLSRLTGDVADVRTLSPSTESNKRALRRFVDAAPRPGQAPKGRSIDPNECAIAIWVETEHARLLLGADVLRGPARCGWQAILSSFTPVSKASLFKVPHHGAPNAHHPEVWTQLLEADAVAVLAPFRGGVTPRPSADDKRRLLGLTSQAYATAATKMPTMSNAMKAQALAFGPLAMSVRDPWGMCGQIRARMSPSGTWQVDTFGPARQLTTAGT